jgi:hypothetical protein
MERSSMATEPELELDTLRAFVSALKYVGFLVFGIVLALIILFSVLRWGFVEDLAWGLLISVIMIGVGMVMEKIL